MPAQTLPPVDDGGEEIDMDMFSMMLEKQLDQSLSVPVGQEPEEEEYEEEEEEDDFLFQRADRWRPSFGGSYIVVPVCRWCQSR